MQRNKKKKVKCKNFFSLYNILFYHRKNYEKINNLENDLQNLHDKFEENE